MSKTNLEALDEIEKMGDGYRRDLLLAAQIENSYNLPEQQMVRETRVQRAIESLIKRWCGLRRFQDGRLVIEISNGELIGVGFQEDKNKRILV